MTKTLKDYSRGLIYKLCCKDVDIKEIYVGSTTNFTQRKRKHKSDCNNVNNKGYNYFVYQFIRENGGWENWSMVTIEKYPCNDELELEQRERYWMEQLKAKLNSRIPTRSREEWIEDNKDKLKEYKKQYNETNKDRISEKRKEYRKANEEKLSKKHKEWCHKNKDKIQKHKKKYRENNRDKIRNKRKTYYEANRDKLREKCECECGAVVCRGASTRHKKSNQHLIWDMFHN